MNNRLQFSKGSEGEDMVELCYELKTHSYELAATNLSTSENY
jgi:hypothetical protein